jgi:hypothetical protein
MPKETYVIVSNLGLENTYYSFVYFFIVVI